METIEIRGNESVDDIELKNTFVSIVIHNTAERGLYAQQCKCVRRNDFMQYSQIAMHSQ